MSNYTLLWLMQNKSAYLFKLHIIVFLEYKTGTFHLKNGANVPSYYNHLNFFIIQKGSFSTRVLQWFQGPKLSFDTNIILFCLEYALLPFIFFTTGPELVVLHLKNLLSAIFLSVLWITYLFFFMKWYFVAFLSILSILEKKL